MQQHKSILDSVTEKLADLKQELGPQDQGKVDEYTDAVRDVERRIQMAENTEQHRTARAGSSLWARRRSLKITWR